MKKKIVEYEIRTKEPSEQDLVKAVFYYKRNARKFLKVMKDKNLYIKKVKFEVANV